MTCLGSADDVAVLDRLEHFCDNLFQSVGTYDVDALKVTFKNTVHAYTAICTIYN